MGLQDTGALRVVQEWERPETWVTLQTGDIGNTLGKRLIVPAGRGDEVPGRFSGGTAARKPFRAGCVRPRPRGIEVPADSLRDIHAR